MRRLWGRGIIRSTMIAPASIALRARPRWVGPLLLLVTTAVCFACAGAAEVVRPLSGRSDVDTIFAEYDRAGSPGCALGVIQDGEFIYRRAYGEANLEYGIALDADSVFRTGSVAKQFTGMLILLLEESGALGLDDDLREWIPEMPDLGPITVRHLLHHTSGLRDYLVLTELAGYREQEFYTPEQLLGLLGRQQALNFAPGEGFLYSNTGYFLLGLIAERASGKGMHELGEAMIFGPLGMTSTQFYADTTQLVPRRASGYAPGDEGFVISMTTLPIVGDGSVFTSVNDLLAWDRNFYDNRLGNKDPALIERWLTPGRLNSGEVAGAHAAIEYAAGIITKQWRGAHEVGHGGGFVGFRAEIVRYPEHRISVITLCNVATATAPRLARQVAEVFLGELLEPRAEPASGDTRNAAPREQPGDEFSLPVSRLREFQGRYVSRELGVTYSLEIRDGRLVASLARRWDRPLKVLRDGGFADPGTGFELQFRHNSAGAVDGFTLDWGRVAGLWFERIG